MTDKEKKYCDVLLSSCELKTDDHLVNYNNAIENLRGSKNPDVLRIMLKSFRDTEAGEIQYELVEACESFPDKTYVDVFLDEGQDFNKISPIWFSLMFQSLLNTDSCVNSIVKKINEIDINKADFYFKFITKLSQENSKYNKILALVARQ